MRKQVSTNFRKIGLIVIVMIALMSCQSDPYEKLVDRELSKGVVNDSLFLGLNLGMVHKDFYAACWKMNKKGLIKQGPNNLSVQYNIDTTLTKMPAYMHFYPEFDDEGYIMKMPMEFTYIAYLPTDPRFQAEALLPDVIQLLEKWYGGNPFIEIKNEDETKTVWVKVDGTRRIRLYKKDLRTVRGDIVNLNTIKELDENV